jgi:hypothetical protein
MKFEIGDLVTWKECIVVVGASALFGVIVSGPRQDGHGELAFWVLDGNGVTELYYADNLRKVG